MDLLLVRNGGRSGRDDATARAAAWAPRVFFRSYAGMTRIRFKGQLDAFSAPYGAPLGMCGRIGAPAGTVKPGGLVLARNVPTSP
jgi:hypothetical protein